MQKQLKTAEIPLELVNYIQSAPVAPQQLMQTASSADASTIEAFRETWVKNITENKKRFGDFASRGVGQLFNSLRYQPAIVAGAGPSLKRNGAELKDRQGIKLISCLHNFHFLEDHGAPADYYVTLDAGEITIEEVSEGGQKTPDEYWEITKGRTLIAYIGTSPRLLEKWQGPVYFFNCPMPHPEVDAAIDAVEKFHTYVSSGGNVLGACLYIAKVIMGANPIAFVGADFSFSYDKKFHGWHSKYDKTIGNVMRTVDIYGHKVYTWASYHGFKCFFDWVAETIPGIYINCTEGGTFGAYPDGNIMSVRQQTLQEFFYMYHMNEAVRENCEAPGAAKLKLTLY